MSSSLKIALVQQHATETLEENIQRGMEAFRKAAKDGAQLVAYAELAFSLFWPQYPSHTEYRSFAQTIPGPITDAFCSLAKDYGIVTVLNLFETDGRQTFDSSPVIDADGQILGVTRMVHIMEGPGFHEKSYYMPGNDSNFVYSTQAGRIGVAICYDRHFPEYMRALAVQGAQLVVVPQAGTVGEWSEGIFEAELQIASFQNGYYAALVNRVGKEDILHFSGESFVTDPWGKVIVRAPQGRDHILYADCDFFRIDLSPAKQHFLPDRRPEFYRTFGLMDEP
ncbi:MAG: nitrilase-related carbon-nitrogen hydrolase [Candidatus Aminicenantales bacterium]